MPLLPFVSTKRFGWTGVEPTRVPLITMVIRIMMRRMRIVRMVMRMVRMMMRMVRMMKMVKVMRMMVRTFPTATILVMLTVAKMLMI